MEEGGGGEGGKGRGDGKRGGREREGKGRGKGGREEESIMPILNDSTILRWRVLTYIVHVCKVRNSHWGGCYRNLHSLHRDICPAVWHGWLTPWKRESSYSEGR